MTRPRQMRRRARMMRRYGLEPVIFISGDGQLPEVAVVVILRWAWRYRSELAPFAVAATTAMTAEFLHITRPSTWWVILATAILALSAVLVLGRLIGLVPLAERIYAALVVLAGGSWLAGAVGLGPLHRPLPQILGVAGLVLAVPWWAHRRRRARVRVERKLDAWPEVARDVGLAGSQVMSAVVDLWGWRARLRLARGQTIDDVRSRLAAIESGLGVFRGAARVYPTPDDLANRIELRVLTDRPACRRDHLARAIRGDHC
ncbi:MAG TPA: hypothetical protein VIV12_07820 [Streptosporangiaceae bacterium]